MLRPPIKAEFELLLAAKRLKVDVQNSLDRSVRHIGASSQCLQSGNLQIDKGLKCRPS